MIGFLKTSNRINVMLSRAKHGMYILGHADTLNASKKSTMWRQVVLLAEISSNLIGDIAYLSSMYKRKKHMPSSAFVLPASQECFSAAAAVTVVAAMPCKEAAAAPSSMHGVPA